MMAWLNPEISLVIPLYNEAENITILYEEIRTSIDPLRKPYEIIFVDDGSSDSTLERLKNMKRKEKRQNETLVQIRIIRFSTTSTIPKSRLSETSITLKVLPPLPANFLISSCAWNHLIFLPTT